MQNLGDLKNPSKFFEDLWSLSLWILNIRCFEEIPVPPVSASIRFKEQIPTPSLYFQNNSLFYVNPNIQKKCKTKTRPLLQRGNFRMAFNWPKHAAAAKEYSFSGIASNPLCRSWWLFCVAKSHQYCTWVSLFFLLVRTSLHAVQSLPCF